jgi:hypothetical protein
VIYGRTRADEDERNSARHVPECLRALRRFVVQSSVISRSLRTGDHHLESRLSPPIASGSRVPGSASSEIFEPS